MEKYSRRLVLKEKMAFVEDFTRLRRDWRKMLGTVVGTEEEAATGSESDADACTSATLITAVGCGEDRLLGGRRAFKSRCCHVSIGHHEGAPARIHKPMFTAGAIRRVLRPVRFAFGLGNLGTPGWKCPGSSLGYAGDSSSL